MTFKQIENQLKIFADGVIELARKNLKRKKKITTGQLYKSLKYKIIPDKNSTILNFEMEDYGLFVDKGVKGKDPNALPPKAKYYGIQKAPNSPYQFGAMKSRGLRKALNRWTVQKNIKGVRDKKGRFLPRKSMQFMMARSIYLSGLEATMFFTDPYNKLIKAFTRKFFDAFIIDVDEKIIHSLNEKK
jgi:hypothetical protein